MKENTKWLITREQQHRLIKALTVSLTDLRARLGISQGEIASIIGVSRQTYSAIECGKRLMSWNTYLSLVMFFDYNSLTHIMLREIGAFPAELIKGFNNGESDFLLTHTIAGIPEAITEKLDDKALYAIRTVVMLEYARCADMTGEDVIKAFEGTSVCKPPTRADIETKMAIKRIKEGYSINE